MIREFLISTYKNYDRPYNWMIDRWSYAIFFHNIMYNMCEENLTSKIGILEDDLGDIIGVVNNETGISGEVYFQLANSGVSEEIINEMFIYAEKNLFITKDSLKYLEVRIPENDKKREAVASRRGYTKSKYCENISELVRCEEENVDLPSGYCMKFGFDVSNLEKGYAYDKAFEYNKWNSSKVTPLAFQSLRKAIDYRHDLDINIISDTNELVTFCNLWYDSINKIGILESVGTIPEYRKKGLAKCAIIEAINRVVKEGVKKYT